MNDERLLTALGITALRVFASPRIKPARSAGVTIQLRRQLRQRVPLPRARTPFGTGKRLPDGRDPATGKPLRPFELVDIGARQREARRPDELRLSLGIQVVEMNRLRRVDLVLRNEGARRQLEDVESAGDLGADHDAVVPVDGPRPAVAHSGRVRIGSRAV